MSSIFQSVKLFVRGPVWIVGAIVSFLFTAVAAVQLVRDESFWMWLFFAALVLVGASFYSFHRARTKPKDSPEAITQNIGGISFQNMYFEGNQTGFVYQELPRQAITQTPGGRTVVRLADLVSERDAVIRDQTYEDADILGPALLLPMHSEFRKCEWVGPFEALVWEVPDDRKGFIGTIGLSGCTFKECRFFNCGMVAPTSEMHILEQGKRETDQEDSP
jgi:hypothetical protein